MSALAFELPQALEAHEPPEARGLARDEVRLMVATRGDGAIVHARFRDLPRFLAPGDAVVVNVSATLPAALAARTPDGRALEVRFSTPAPQAPGPEWWVVELRAADGGRHGEREQCLEVAGGGTLEIVAPFAALGRLWLARADVAGGVSAHLHRHGRPVRYGYVPREWPLADYQTAYALAPGSAEMPSAGRPFTSQLVTRLAAGGVLVAPLTLHTGVSSPERDEAPYPERYEVPAATARVANAVHGWGGRVIAVGTTVVRALETVTDAAGAVRAGRGWTSLVVTPERGLRAVDGLITGWHEPRASHLDLLAAAAGPELLERSYREALEHGYLWHEFGDSHLVLP